MELKNKIAVITGASRGLGKEIALLLAKEHCKLALIARSEKELSSLVSEIKKSGESADYFVCDITDSVKVFETIKDITKKLGRIDILINNAGIYLEGNLEDHEPERIKQMFDVVVLGTIYATMAVVPLLKKQKSGQILNINSIAGVSTPGTSGPYTPYTSAKHAVTGFTNALAEELHGTGIKVLDFHPGGMNTEIFKTAGYNYRDSEDWMMNKQDIAKIAVFMLKQPEDVLIESMVVRKFNKD